MMGHKLDSDSCHDNSINHQISGQKGRTSDLMLDMWLVEMDISTNHVDGGPALAQHRSNVWSTTSQRVEPSDTLISLIVKHCQN